MNEAAASEVGRVPRYRAAYFFLFWLSTVTRVTTSVTSAISSELAPIISANTSLTSTGITSLQGELAGPPLQAILLLFHYTELMFVLKAFFRDEFPLGNSSLFLSFNICRL